MVGSPLVASLVAHGAFWILLVLGLVSGELGLRGAGLALAAWIGGWLWLPSFFVPWLAVLDIGLALAVLKGDVRLF